jgi:DNA primase, catalytic core
MFNRYSEELIEEIRINNDIVDVVSEYVKLEKKGKNYFGLCPFHREKTPSFSVEPSKQIFYCFSCSKGGNVFQFISLAEKLDFIEAVRFLADRAKIQLPEGDDEEQIEKTRQKQEVMKVNLLTARYFYDTLNSAKGEGAREYLKKRGISEHTVRRFGLGYSTGEWDGLLKFLEKKGFSEQIVLKSGLAISGKNGKVFDRFRERIMFPIFDVRGNVIAFGGRVMDSTMPKYMNSPETPVYSKGKQLYALNFAKNSGEKRLIIVEGYMDVISLHQSGIINAVASLGTALTDSQGRVLKKYAEEIVISYDSDTAGLAATMRGLDLLNDIGCNVKVMTVPDGKDPDEFVKRNSAEDFKKLANSALTLIEYKIKMLRNEIDMSTTEGKILFLNKVADLISKLGSEVEREMYTKKIATENDISEESMYAEVFRRIKPKGIGSTKNVKNTEIGTRQIGSITVLNEKRLIHEERFILSLLCVDNSIYKSIKDKLTVEMFSDGENRRLAGIILERLVSNKEIVPAELLNMINKDYSGEFARILNEECHCDDNIKAILGKIRDIEYLKAELRQKQVLELLKNESTLHEGDVDKLKQELRDLNMLIKKKKSM